MALSDNPTIGPFLGRTRFAYFTMELAINSAIHTYSGGLGVLAGDTARACADLELPIVFVTLVSRRGYLKQIIDEKGRQIDEEDPWDPSAYCAPLRAKVGFQIEGRDVWVRPWLNVIKSPLGYPVPIVLLDTDLEENHPDDRRITDRLYGGDDEYRLKQEIVLGICGRRMLAALGFTINTFHLNEGHAALLALDLLRRYPRAQDQTKPNEIHYDIPRVREMCIFTTHTPVEAGHDRFPYPLVQRLIDGYFDWTQLRHLAGEHGLNMTHLALRLSGYVNGVAVRHAKTTERMFPGYRIRAVTNGVHLPTWVSPAIRDVLNEFLPYWAHEPEILNQADQIPPERIWQAHRKDKAALIDFVGNASGLKLDIEQPIIGYARRMTAYKRPELIFSDLDRLARIARRFPFQIVLAGKAHPRDDSGKAHIQAIHEHIRQLAGKVPVAFLPGYDLDLAKSLVSGVDVWLNTPVPPLEASGTSGMKAALNGVLNLSMLDGWWIEGCIEGVTGWGIGTDHHEIPESEAALALYAKLEEVVLPLYYGDRAAWMVMMRSAISKIASYFNTHRMMRRYVAEAYVR